MECDAARKLPRLYVNVDLAEGQAVALEGAQAHYLRTVLRRQDGDGVRLFNARHGEWTARLEGLARKGGAAVPDIRIREQPTLARRVHLLFAPIKKTRMDFLIEKVVELGATDLHPVLTHNTEVRKVNEERLRQQIIEAAEQCERLDIPALHTLTDLHDKIVNWRDEPVFACLERTQAPALGYALREGPSPALLIGPEGGFTKEETAFLADRCAPVSLGPNILRSETAALKALALLS